MRAVGSNPHPRARTRRAARIGGVDELLLPVEETLVEKGGGGRAGYRWWDDESARLDTSLPFWEHSQSHRQILEKARLEDVE
jgi:hypothetical protein